MKLVMRKHWWQGVMRDVGKYVDRYNLYQRMKNKTEVLAEKLIINKVLEKLQTYLIVKFITKLLLVVKKNTILVICDRLSKIAHFVTTTKETSVKGLARLFKNNVQKLYELSVISQTLKHVRNMFDFNMISNPHSYLALFVPKTLLVVQYFIINLIPLKVHGYFTLFESKYMVIFIFVHCLIIFFKLCKFTQTLCRVFPSPNQNSYVVFY